MDEISKKDEELVKKISEKVREFIKEILDITSESEDMTEWAFGAGYIYIDTLAMITGNDVEKMLIEMADFVREQKEEKEWN